MKDILMDNTDNTIEAEQPKPDFKRIINERLTEATTIIVKAQEELGKITDELVLEKIMAGGVLYYQSTPAAALGKVFGKPEEALIFSTLVAAYFCKSGEALLNMKPEEENKPQIIIARENDVKKLK